jgi:hypothetical protein
MAAYGATSSLPAAPAKVSSRSDLPTFAIVLAERSKHRAKSNFSISGCSTERGRRRRRNLERQGSLSELGQSALARGNHAMEPLSNKLA